MLHFRRLLSILLMNSPHRGPDGGKKMPYASGIVHDLAGAGAGGRKTMRRQRGQAMVELAMVLPVFLILVLGIIDFGWALRNYVMVTNSAREGARLGVTGAEGPSIVERTVNTSAGLLKPADVAVTNAAGLSGSLVKVDVTYQHQFITPLGALLGKVTGGGTSSDTLTLKSSTSMRLE
jgi:Flp pilus assembly protein TadG